MIPTLKKPNMILFVLLLAPFCKPVSIDTIPALDKLFTLWKLAAIAYLLITLPPKCFRAKPSGMPMGLLGLGVFWLIYTIGCIRVGVDVVSVITAAISSILILCLIRYELGEGNGYILLRSIACLFTFCILAHIFSVFFGILRSGISDKNVYLFGMDNYSAFFLYPMLCVVLFYHSLRYGRMKAWSWCLLLSLVAVYLLTASMTAAGAGLLLTAFYLVHSCWDKLPKLRGVRWLVAVLAVLLVLICGFEIQNLLASLLNSMSKGVTLNSRTYIWADALELIRMRPFFGHGSFTQEQINAYILYGTTHAHNLLLEILLRTGIMGSIGYLMFLCGFVPAARTTIYDTPHRNLLLCGLLAQLVLSFMDFYPTILVFYFFMGVLYFSDGFERQIAPRKKETV